MSRVAGRDRDRRGRRSRPRGVRRLGARLTDGPLPARKLADAYAQPAQTCPDSASGIADTCGPGSPDSHRVVWGLTSRPPVPPAGFPPVSRLPAGFSPVARLPRFPVVRRSPVRPLRPSPGFRFPFRCPSGFPFPWAIFTIALPPARFRRRWSRAARAKVTSPAATPRLDLAVIRPAPQMGSGWARWMPPRIARYERPRAQGTAAPEPPRSNIFRLILGLPQAASERRCSSSVSVQLLVAVRKPELIPASATCGTGTVPLRAEYRAVHGQVRDACCAMLQQRLIRSRGTRRFRAMPGTTVRVCYLTAE